MHIQIPDQVHKLDRQTSKINLICTGVNNSTTGVLLGQAVSGTGVWALGGSVADHFFPSCMLLQNASISETTPALPNHNHPKSPNQKKNLQRSLGKMPITSSYEKGTNEQHNPKTSHNQSFADEVQSFEASTV